MAKAQAFLRRIGARRAIAALALASWVGVIVLASGGGPNETRWVSTTGAQEALTTALAAFFLLGVVVVIIVRPSLPFRHGQPQRRSSTQGMILMMLGLAALAYALSDLNRDREPPVAAEPVFRTAEEPESSNAGNAPSGGDLATLVGAAGAALGAILWSRQRHHGAGSASLDEPTAEAELEHVVSRSTALLRENPDPRAAVLAAYATLEAALSDRGEPRHRSETVAEHLGRVLESVPHLAEPAQRLGELYEIARFSEVTITEQDRQSAVAALQQSLQNAAAMGGHGP
jgi:hypothetical protein